MVFLYKPVLKVELEDWLFLYLFSEKQLLISSLECCNIPAQAKALGNITNKNISPERAKQMFGVMFCCTHNVIELRGNSVNTEQGIMNVEL